MTTDRFRSYVATAVALSSLLLAVIQTIQAGRQVVAARDETATVASVLSVACNVALQVQRGKDGEG